MLDNTHAFDPGVGGASLVVAPPRNSQFDGLVRKNVEVSSLTSPCFFLQEIGTNKLL